MSSLLARIQRIVDRLPNPLLEGQDAEQYFNANRKMGSNPDVYGWYQSRMVVQAGAERPVRSFSESLQGLSFPAKNSVQ
jgi:hypothetical protein